MKDALVEGLKQTIKEYENGDITLEQFLDVISKAGKDAQMLLGMLEARK